MTKPTDIVVLATLSDNTSVRACYKVGTMNSLMQVRNNLESDGFIKDENRSDNYYNAPCHFSNQWMTYTNGKVTFVLQREQSWGSPMERLYVFADNKTDLRGSIKKLRDAGLELTVIPNKKMCAFGWMG